MNNSIESVLEAYYGKDWKEQFNLSSFHLVYHLLHSEAIEQPEILKFTHQLYLIVDYVNLNDQE